MLNLFSRFPLRTRRILQLLMLGGAVAGVSLVVGQATPPLIDLAAEPLYMNGAKAKANLTISLSVEFPTVGQTYRDEFDVTKEYVGYFDPKACYRHVPASGSLGAYFDWAGAPTATGDCGGGGFNGNFMNWATSSAIDILRYGLTGGNRVVDDDTGNHRTIVERAWLPDSFYRSSAYFSQKRIRKTLAQSMVETALYNKITGTYLYIYNCRNRVYFATAADNTGNGSCSSPFETSATSSSHPYLIGSTNNQTYYEVRNLVCDPNSATNRLMSYDPATRQWQGLCYRYPSGKYKPVGQFQMNADNIRVSVFGYLNHDDKGRYGGVLRAPMKYLGPRHYDQAFNLIAGTNPRSEWDATTGKFIENPQAGDGTYDNQGYPRSGAIMYINKFGTLNPDAIGDYKTFDPVSELYYEAIRYLQGLQPTPEAITGLNGTVANDKARTENFPVYRTWTNPFSGFVDSSGDAQSCLRNSILAIADVFTHADHSVPGSNVTNATTGGDFTRSVATNPTLNVPFWSNVVGAFESKTTMTYTDSMGRSQTTTAPTANTDYDGLQNAGTLMTGAGTGSYHMAGLAYWAHTQSFNPTYPKARVRTFAIDVNENRSSDNVDFRRTRQLYLAAKYGGFDDNQAGSTGSPYRQGGGTDLSNVLWQGTDGDAKNYFLVSDAKKFLDSLAEVFSKVVEETGSIAGGAISVQKISVGESAAVFQAFFNPVANYWSGSVEKRALTLSADQSTVVIASTPTWDAGKVLTNTTKVDYGVNRKIVIGPPKGMQGTDAPTNFKWAELVTTHQAALNSAPDGTTDTMGERRLNYLRGDQRDEMSATNPTGLFRPRDIVLGDVVNSALVYMGKPSLSTSGADFRTFYDTNKNRKPVIFVNANDGMLHAFFDQTGAEAFAYIPGFLANKLKYLPDMDYTHTSFADATPAVGDAYARSAWRTVLVSGVGGGGQGVFALDVTNPETFTKDNVMWEFTDRDHAAMGNVVGTPQILKFRMTDSTATSHTYKWFAVVPSGVNNYASDGYQHSGGNPSIFLLDLNFTPTSSVSWTEGTNFWRIELPQTSTAMAKGLVGLSAVRSLNGAVDTLYAGDLQGNLWKLDFSTRGLNQLVASATTNFATFNEMASDAPLFIAKANTTALQPITGEPVIASGYSGQSLVAFGTGKFMEAADTTVPLNPTASFYVVADSGGTTAVSGRSALQAGTVTVSVSGTSGTVTIPSFSYATKPGWYFDFDVPLAERLIGDIVFTGNIMNFNTIYPTRGSCGEGGGRGYSLDVLSGAGTFQESTIGMLAPVIPIEIAKSNNLTRSDSTGRRIKTITIQKINQGSKGMAVGGASSTVTIQKLVGRLSWRQLHNYQTNKNK
jgi:type IV pilus assembly protein PilY1